MRNIVLIGMPGAGKSTLGVLLAKALNMDFVDADLVIQKNNGKLLYQIIEEKGLDEFLRIEEQELIKLNVYNTVIATGGSAVFGSRAMEELASNGTVVYIKLSCDEIIRRVNNITTRGIAMKKGKSLKDVYEERVPLYEKYADIIIEADGTTIEECVAKLVEAL